MSAIPDNRLSALNCILDGLGRIRAALECLTHAVETFSYWWKTYHFVFDGSGAFTGMAPKYEPNIAYPASDDMCVAVASACRHVPEWVRELRNASDDTDKAIEHLPDDQHDNLSQLAGKPWRAAIRSDLLLFVTVWPGETLTCCTLGSRKVSDSVPIFIDHINWHDPLLRWREYQQYIDRHSAYLVAVNVQGGGKKRGRDWALTKEQAEDAVKRRADGEKWSSIADDYDVTVRTVQSNIKHHLSIDPQQIKNN